MKILSIPWSLLRNIYAGFFYIPTHLQHGSGNIRVYNSAVYLLLYIYILYGWRASIVSVTTNTRGSGSPPYTSLTHPPTLLTTTCRIRLCPLEWTWTAKSATSILTQLL